MKTMRKVFQFMSILILLAISINAAAAELSNQRNPVGNWRVQAVAAGEGMNVSRLTIKFEEEKYIAEINFEQIGYRINASRVTWSENVLRINFLIEGEDVSVRLTFVEDDNDKMSGSASTPLGDIPLTVTRIKETAAK